MNMQQMTEQFRQELLKSAADNYAAQLNAQLDAMEAMRKKTEAAYLANVAAINARYGVDEPKREISEDGADDLSPASE